MGTWICFTAKCRDRNQQLNLEKLKAKVEIKKDNNDRKEVKYKENYQPEWANTLATGQFFAHIGTGAQGIASAITASQTGGLLGGGQKGFTQGLLDGITGQNTSQNPFLPDNQTQSFNISQFMPIIIIGALLMFIKK